MKKVNKSKQIKYLGYARKSLEEEEKQRQSIPAQVRLIKEHAQKYNFKLIDILPERKSAKYPGRKVFNQLLTRIEKGEVQGLIVWHPDRLSRNSLDAGRLIYFLDTGVLKDLQFTSGYNFTNDPQGKFVLAIAFGQSKYFSDNLSINVKRGLREKAERGEYPQQAPRGYLNDKATKTIVVDKNIACFIKQAFKLYAKGRYSLLDISQYLFQHGVTTRTNRPIKDEDIRQTLKNPFYYGHFRWDNELFEGKHKPIITKKLYDRVQKALFKRSPHRKYAKEFFRKKHNFPYSGLFKCGECGYTITAERHNKYYKGTNRWVHYDYYRCTKNNPNIKCFQPYANQHLIMPQLKKIIKKLTIPEQWRDLILAKIEKKKKEYQKQYRKHQRNLGAKLKDLDEKQDKLTNFLLDGTIGRQEYLRAKRKILNQRKEIQEKLVELAKKTIHPGFELFKDWINLLYQANETSKTKSPFELGSWFHQAQLNLKLKDKKIKFTPEKQWAALRAAPTTRSAVPLRGIEPRFSG